MFGENVSDPTDISNRPTLQVLQRLGAEEKIWDIPVSHIYPNVRQRA
jgi:hypothetical protein